MNHNIHNLRNLNDAMMASPTNQAYPTRPMDIRALKNQVSESAALHAAVGTPPVDSGLLRLIRSEESVHCFGGYLFRRENPQYGHVICFAVENMSKEDALNADKWYNLFGRMSHLGILHRTASAPIQVNNYTVFEFVASACDKSIREHLQAVEPMRTSHELLMEQLVRFIHDYSLELKQYNYEKYVALCCLSKDTILIDPNGRMKVLPLRANRGIYPIEIPQEVTACEPADERSDLFSAAYLAVEVYSKNRNCAQLTEPDSDIIRNCLKAIHDWRPSLSEAYAATHNAVPNASRTPVHKTPISIPTALQPTKIAEKFQKVKGYVQDLVRPYELEEGESSFQLDGTIHESAIPRNEPINLGDSTGDSTFGPANH